jgi:hypothetical protein
MVALAPCPSGRSPKIAFQKITTVMLEPIQKEVESSESVVIP